MRIWKFSVPIQGQPIDLSMPIGATVIHLATQRGDPYIWVKTRPTGPSVVRRFRWFGTGQDFDEEAVIDHVGTVLIEDGALVFHLFEVH